MDNIALLIIDPQNDFCDSKNGALGVPGAEKDCYNINKLLTNNDFSDVFVTLDTHYPIDISHPLFWVDKNNEHPEPFTIITTENLNKDFFPLYYKQHVSNYIEYLEKDGQYNHVIWPQHCIFGSEGYQIDDYVMEGLINFSERNKKNFNIIVKGENPLTEHFGAFKAQMQLDDKTKLDTKLLAKLYHEYDYVEVVGEAKSHCVANSLKQINDFYPQLNEKLYIREHCMSNVPGFENIAEEIFQKSVNNGANIITKDG